jgi:hypothetical protein
MIKKSQKFFIKNDEMIDIQYANCFIKVSKNYCYEEAKLLSNKKYHSILDAANNISKKNKYINSIRNSHDLVCYLMILMNYHCAKELIKYKTGIFRSIIIKREYHVPDTIPEEVGKFIKILNSTTGQYVDGSTIIDTRHDTLDLEAYIHITSPNRRLVDLLNLIQISEKCGIIAPSQSCSNFVLMHLQKMDYINQSMRLIRKIQTDCELIDRCSKTPELIKKNHRGILFDKTERNDGRFTYMVYLEEVGLLSRIHLYESIDNYCLRIFRMFIFEDEVKRKIRLQIVE